MNFILALEITLFILIFACVIINETSSIYNTISNNHIPISVLYWLIACSIGVITLIFGVESNVISSNSKNKDLTETRENSWFNLRYTYAFPVEQFLISRQEYINDKMELDRDEQNHFQEKIQLVVVDHTASTKETDYIVTNTIMTKIQLQEALLKGCLATQELKSNISYSDLLAMSAIAKTCTKDSMNNLNVLNYYGEFNGASQFRHQYNKYQRFNSRDACIPIAEYIKNKMFYKNSSSLKHTNRLVSTNYAHIVNHICNMSLSDNQINNFPDKKISVVLIGDFYDEENYKSSYKYLKKALGQLQKKYIYQLKLIVIPSNNSSLTAKENVRETLKIFNDYFLGKNGYDQVDALAFDEELKPDDYLNSLLVFPRKSTSMEPEINFHYPYNNEDINNGAVSYVKIFKHKKPFSGNLLISLRSRNVELSMRRVCVIDNTDYLHVNQSIPVFVKNGTIQLQFNEEIKDNHDLYLDIFEPTENFKIQTDIVFRDTLDETTAISLICAFTFLCLSTTGLIVFYGINLYKLGLNKITKMLGAAITTVSIILCVIIISPSLQIAQTYILVFMLTIFLPFCIVTLLVATRL